VVFGANGLETFRQEGIGVRSPARDAGCQYHGWIHTVVWLRQFDKMGLKVSSFTTLHLYRSMHVFFYGHTLFFTQKKT